MRKLSEGRKFCPSGETFDAHELRRFLAEECAEIGGQKAWATKHGVSAAYVSDVLRARREPGPGIAQALGFGVVTLYRPLMPPAAINDDG